MTTYCSACYCRSIYCSLCRTTHCRCSWNTCKRVPPCGHVIAATYGTAGCQLPICAGDREAAAKREGR